MASGHPYPFIYGIYTYTYAPRVEWCCCVAVGKDYQKHATGLIELLASAHLNHYTSLEAVMAKLCNPPADVDFELKPEVVAHIIR